MRQPVTVTTPGTEHQLDTLDELLKLKQLLVEKLFRNSDYRALVAIEHAIVELKDEHEAATRRQDEHEAATGRPLSSRRIGSSHPSHGEAVAQLLSQKGHPLSMRELITQLRHGGIKFVGKDPKLSLSATLSRSRQFRSVSYDGERCWWFANRPLPNDHNPADATQDVRLAH